MIRVLVNLAATLVLVLLLAAPGVFSGNLTHFEGENLGLEIKNNSDKFGQFLKLEEVHNNNKLNYNLEFTKFENQLALYKGVLEIVNLGNFEKTVKILETSTQVQVFFDAGLETQGPAEVKLSPKQKVGINLLVPQNTQTKSTSFSLESN